MFAGGVFAGAQLVVIHNFLDGGGESIPIPDPYLAKLVPQSNEYRRASLETNDFRRRTHESDSLPKRASHAL